MEGDFQAAGPVSPGGVAARTAHLRPVSRFVSRRRDLVVAVVGLDAQHAIHVGRGDIVAHLAVGRVRRDEIDDAVDAETGPGAVQRQGPGLTTDGEVDDVTILQGPAAEIDVDEGLAGSVGSRNLVLHVADAVDAIFSAGAVGGRQRAGELDLGV